jgi:4-amino-4-deoxy-L-arabinose transferase-like glycosyltransferase
MEAAVRPPGSDGGTHSAPSSYIRRGQAGVLRSLALVFALAIVISQWPLAFGDTYHLLAAQMVAAGRKPYLDFFVQQVPLYPLICGAWLRIFGTSWQAANLFSGLLICGSAAMVARIARRIYAEAEWGARGSIIAVLLFGLNLLVAQSGDDAQPYALCMFFCLSAWLAALDARPTIKRIFLAGLAAGAAVNTSLLAVPFFLILTGWCMVNAGGSDRLRRLLWFTCGAAVASIPLAYLAMLAPTQAWFDIVEFQLFYRTAAPGLPKNVASHNLHEIMDWVRSIQGAALVLLSLAGTYFLCDHQAPASTRRSIRYAASIAVLWALYLSFVPLTWHMYFVLVVPYASLLAAAGLCQLCARARSLQWSSKVLVGTMVLYSLGLAMPLVAGVLSRRPARWAPPEEAARIVNAKAGLNEPMYSDDESIYVAARRLPPHGLENSFGAVLRLPAGEYERAGLAPPEQNEDQLRAGNFAAVVLTKANTDARIQVVRSGGLYPQSVETKNYVVFWKSKVQGAR